MIQTVELSDLQERVLCALRMAEERSERTGISFHPDGWYPVKWVMQRRSPRTLTVLEALGLIETCTALGIDPVETADPAVRDLWRRRGTGARVTEAGRMLLDSMGD